MEMDIRVRELLRLIMCVCVYDHIYIVYLINYNYIYKNTF